jgi:tetratricopeptide (TPR) repeat protein
MKKYSKRIPYKVTASLPFPLRLEGGPYNVIGNLGEAELSFETIRQTAYDARLLIESGEFDFQSDRHGWASYTRVSCDITANRSIHPIATLLECLNQLIRNLRDITSCFWLHDLEKVDLFQMSVESEREYTEPRSWGRAGGITLPVTGVSAEAEKTLRTRLSSREQVLEWRLLQLDSRDPSLGFSVTALADVYIELDQVGEAEEVVERYPGAKQRSPSYLSTKANILRRKGDYDAAEGLLKKAIRLQPYNVVLYGGMVQVKFEQAQQLMKKRDKQSALIIIEEARNYISSGLQIEAENELLLSLEHMIRKLRSQIGY